MNDTAPTREQIVAELAEAQAAVDDAAARMYAADALHEVTSLPGLRYAPATADLSSYVVGCDGQAIGRMWRGPEGHLLGGWTCAPFGATDRLGPYQTARAAAAALAQECGVTPTHEATA
jgi:hypothetical protein